MGEAYLRSICSFLLCSPSCSFLSGSLKLCCLSHHRLLLRLPDRLLVVGSVALLLDFLSGSSLGSLFQSSLGRLRNSRMDFFGLGVSGARAGSNGEVPGTVEFDQFLGNLGGLGRLLLGIFRSLQGSVSRGILRRNVQRGALWSILCLWSSLSRLGSWLGS